MRHRMDGARVAGHGLYSLRLGRTSGYWAALLLLFVCVRPLSADAPAQFNGQQALDYTRAIVSFGERVPGSPAHRRTEEYILSELKKDGASVESDRFTAQTPRGPLPMNNIIARFGPPGQPIILLAGHYDTKFLPGFVGANDGGSSTGVLLEIANVLHKAPPKFDVWLLFLDGEEAVKDWTATDSVYGSRHLAQKLAQEGLLPKIRGLILADMIGDKDLDIAKEMNSTPWLRDFVATAARETGYSRYFFQQEMYVEDDHQPFLHVGIPSVDLIDFTYGGPTNPYWHNRKDTMDKLSAHSFQVVGSVMLKTVELLERQ